MSTLTEQFAKDAYKPKYFIGDRVFGRYNKIPFVGTVGNDRNKVGGDPNPEVIIHLDLPMVKNGQVITVLVVEHKNIKQKLTIM